MPSTTERVPPPVAADPPSAPPAPSRPWWVVLADDTWAVAQRIHLGTRKPSNWLQLVQFGVVGASGYAINLVAFAVFAEGLGLHHVLAAMVAFCFAVTNNFLWNRSWTFRASAARGRAGFQAARFFTVSVGGLAVNIAVLVLLVDGLGFAGLPSQAAAVAIAMPVNFIGNKVWTFG